ncbi:MAG: antibiotic biosynthesis monooxygenase [Gordonia sp. (in: high G+C Gram-positive bacteria)]|nr:MAG: antibiotic biosynthesis monooxygenase [Gordonia sp. (in: high G+C Gram-positive bacteria)]
MAIAKTPKPPYVVVIFSSIRTGDDGDGYASMAEEMDRLAAAQPGYLGVESARDVDGFGLTASYWTDEQAARAWKGVAEHAVAQRLGRERWYRSYRVRIATVTREYGF